MLRALAVARFRVVLLPREARALPVGKHGVDKVGAESRVQGAGAGGVRGGRGEGDFLDDLG